MSKILSYFMYLNILMIMGLTLSTTSPLLSKGVSCTSKFSLIMVISNILVWLFVMNSYKKMLASPTFMYFTTLTVMFMSSFLFFMTTTLFLFFITFELGLILILIVILGWGYQVERVQASLYLLFYTLFWSLPFMVMLIFLLSNSYSTSWFMLNNSKMSLMTMTLIMMPFIVKFPVYFMHLWLPKAHVEAPTPGSIILASILLKMGSYGIYRMVSTYDLSTFFNYGMIIGMVGSGISVIMCMLQSDMKSLIAYSSVNHMTLMFWSLMSLQYLSIKGTLLLMLSHALISSVLFLMVGSLYNMYKHRITYFIQGLNLTSSLLSGILFLIMVMNFSVPPMLSVYSELMIMSSVINWSMLSTAILSMVIFLSCYYCLMIYSNSSHSKPNSLTESSLINEFILNSFLMFSMMVMMLMLFLMKIS